MIKGPSGDSKPPGFFPRPEGPPHWLVLAALLFSVSTASKPECRLGRRCFKRQMRFQQVGLDGAAMPNRARLIYQCLKLVIFIAVLIAVAWSIWRLV
jgi:hypothetical protein